MLIELGDWWLNQMRGLLPARMLRPPMLPDARIIAIDRLEESHAHQPSGAVLLRRRGLEAIFAPLDLDHPGVQAQPALPTGLRLPPDAVLCREVTLPMAAARNVEAAIGFEIDRLTPFTAAELFWDIGEVQLDRTLGQIRVQLFFVPQARVENLLLALRRIGLSASFIEANFGPAGTVRIDLGAQHRPAARWRQSALAALCGVLALTCLASPFLRQQIAIDATARDVAASGPAAATAQGLRRQLEIAASGQAAIAQARRSGDPLQVLAALTDALPDGTWLDDLSLKSGDLTFDGRSSNAAALIGRVTAAPGLDNPSFVAPVTRTADGSADEFSMQASVGQ